jgi:opacity protein-like surface antigen
MKKMLVLVSFLAASGLAVAQETQSNFYFGFGAGQSDLNTHKYGQLNYTSFDEKDTMYKVFAGYSFNKSISAELSYNNLGESKATITNGGGMSATNKASATVLALKIAPLPDATVSPFVKLGVSYLKVKETSTEPSSFKKNASTLYYGVGAEYAISKTVALLVEYEAFGKVGITDVNANGVTQVKPKSISTSLRFNF